MEGHNWALGVLSSYCKVKPNYSIKIMFVTNEHTENSVSLRLQILNMDDYYQANHGWPSLDAAILK